MRGRLGRRLSRWEGVSPLHWGVMGFLILGSLLQEPGKTTFDTKFDLTADPIAMLGRSLHLWDNTQNFGGVGDQAYGYLFPQGPWFVLGHLLGAPDWITQRLWSALVLLIAYTGARRLAHALGIGTKRGPIVVGLAYALSPRLFALAGVLSGEVLPTAVLPWVCLPLVLGLQGRISARRAGLLAGVAFLFVGGVNAVEDMAILPLPLFIVLCGLRSGPGKRLAAWWAGATAAAACWWLLPLVVLGKYSPPFLDYVETSATTTRTSGWSNSVRGAEHWLNYLMLGGRPWWQGAQDLSGQAWLVVLAALIAAIGIAGLVHPGMPLRRPLMFSLLLGMLCLTIGHGGPIGSPLAEEVRNLLNGPLAPFRNIHKVDPLVRLPLALGFGHACIRVSRADLAGRARRLLGRRWHLVGVSAALVVLVPTAAPMFAGDLRHPGWSAVPSAWTQAAAWLNHDGPGTTLVVPSSASGQQSWGWTSDEPIQGLSSAAWATRTQVPLTPAPTVRLLDGLDERLESEAGSPALAATLASAGVTRVLLRNDLDTAHGDVGDPVKVAAALADSPGLTLVKSFGDPSSPSIEIFRVDGAMAAPQVVADDTPVLVGGPEDVISAREAGLLGPGQHVVVGLPPRGTAPAIIGDGYRRVERQFGRVHDAVSDVMTLADPMRLHRKVADYPSAAGVPRVYASYGGLKDVIASSSTGYADSFGHTVAAFGPAAAVDGDPATYWLSAPFTTLVGQQISLDLRRRQPIGLVQVDVVTDPFIAAPITQVRIAVGANNLVADVNPLTGLASANFGQAVARSVQVSVASVGPHSEGSPVGIRDITVQGVDQRRTLVIPDTGANASTSFVFTAQSSERACVAARPVRCDLADVRPAPEGQTLSRTFTIHGAGTWDISGSVVALSGDGASNLAASNPDTGMTATSNSVYGGDPAVGPMFAIDRNTGTSWISQPGDANPSITLTWNKRRVITRLGVASVLSSVDSVAPISADLRTPDGQRRSVEFNSGTFGSFAPLPARSVTITFHLGSNSLPMSVGEIHLAGLDGLSRPVAQQAPVRTNCGTGPEVVVDGTSYATRVTGTVASVIQGSRLAWTLCNRTGSTVKFSAGTHRVDVMGTAIWSPTSTVLRSSLALPMTPNSRSSEILGAARTQVKVGAGGRAILLLGQNQNVGWTATLDGRTLAPIVVDGWQQGFLIPAGSGGTIHIRFAGDRLYAITLIVGALAAFVLVGLLVMDLARSRRRVSSSPLEADSASRSRRSSAFVRALFPARRWTRWIGIVLALVAGAVLGGSVFAAAAAVGVVICTRGRPWVVGAGAAVAVAISGALALVDGLVATGSTFTGADLAAAIGIGLAAATLVDRSRYDGSEGARPPAGEADS